MKLKNIFTKNENAINSYADFWNWFQKHEKDFFNVVKQQRDVEKNFFHKLSPELEALKDGFYYLTGMYDDDTVELIITPDGDLCNIVFVEELVRAAPALPGWKFTALKPELSIENVNIHMAGYEFNSDTMSFYSNEHPEYPDEIDIVIVHNQYNEEDKHAIVNGTYIFLDNYLGELNSVTTLDNVTVIPKEEAPRELVPIAKLKDYLIWRQKEFVEKYEGIRYNTEEDSYSVFEGERDGLPLIAVINTDLLQWDGKASHPWILQLDMKYDGENNNGLPEKPVMTLMENVEDGLIETLKEVEGYLHIGRETAKGIRELYFACKDFRLPSKLVYQLQEEYKDKLEMSYSIYKDKYWMSFNRFCEV